MTQQRTLQVDTALCDSIWELPPSRGRCTAEYADVSAAKHMENLRLVLTERAPGPWGESAKAVLHVKGIPYIKVGHSTGTTNGELFAWTGRSNAPVAVHRDDQGVDRSIDGWAGILHLAEKIEPQPSLYPSSSTDRALMIGLSHEICGEGGLGWSRRLMTLHEAAANPQLLEDEDAAEIRVLGAKYGYSDHTGRSAGARVCEILDLLTQQLRRQHAAGHPYLMGPELSAVDLYWACFSQFLEPYPEDLSPMDHWPGLREGYTLHDPLVRQALAPELLAHRDLVYHEHLELPLDY